MKDKIELLAPAGNLDCLRAAVESGADAVYLGGNKFGARAFASNFSEEDFISAVEYAHIRGVLIYVTVNILVHDSEIDELLKYVKFLYEIGIDAVIVQDVGVFSLIRRLMPDFPIHCSTQMAIHNLDGVKLMEAQGAKKVVLARELSINEVKKITEATKVPIEIFIHGALCIAYSGQCLMSSLIGGRSGNRGMCAQPCRKKYTLVNRIDGSSLATLDRAYLMSTRDLKTIEKLEEVMASGVESLKIEGRMKRPEYVATVVNSYRNKIDNIYKKSEMEDIQQTEYELEAIFNREFTQGYLFDKKNKEITSIERPDNRGVFIGEVISKSGNKIGIRIDKNFLTDGDSLELYQGPENSTGFTISGMQMNGQSIEKAVSGQTITTFCRQPIPLHVKVYKSQDQTLNEKALREYSYLNRKKIGVKGQIFIKKNEKPRLVLTTDTETIAVEGQTIVGEAVNRAIAKEDFQKQLNKTGDTPYIFKDIEITLDDNCFMSIKAINSLRREAVDLLNRARIHTRNYEGSIDVVTVGKKSETRGADCITAGVLSIEQGRAALGAGADEIYINGRQDAEKILDLCKEYAVPCYFILPNILNDRQTEEYEVWLTGQSFDGLVISNIGQLALAQRLGIKSCRGNYSLNIFNKYACDYYSERLERICLSVELTAAEVKEIGEKASIDTEVFAYGHLPVMTMEYCPLSWAGTDKNCDKICQKGEYGLIDEKGKMFPLVKNFYMGMVENCRTQVLNSDIIFLDSYVDSVKKLPIKALRLDFYFENYDEVYKTVKLYKDFEKYSLKYKSHIEIIKTKGYTKGHFRRGVE